MSEKFFEAGHYLTRLDNIRPLDAKPKKRIHLNFSMAIDEAEAEHAPAPIRRVWEIVANPKLDTFHVPISSQFKGIDIEFYATEPGNTKKMPPVLVCVRNAILRDIRLDRRKINEREWGVRLMFAVGIMWDPAVWEWGADYVFMECFAKYSRSQSELFDEHPADTGAAVASREQMAAEASQEAPGPDPAKVEALAQDLNTDAAEVEQSPAIDPLTTDPKPKRKREDDVLAFRGKGSQGERPNA